MADTEEAPTFDPSMKKKKSRKSVAFAGEEEGVDGDKSTAETHSLPSPSEENGNGKSVSELTEQVDELDLSKIKKKKKSKKAADSEEAAADGEFDPTALKKRRKKSKKAPEDFDAQLAEAGLAPKEGEGADEEIKPEDAGDLLLGTGVWNAESTVDLTYPLLLTRFFTLLRTQHPDLAGDGRKSYKIPPPQVLREGNKKTIFANISDICKRMKRHDEHVTQFLFAELGTSGSVDGSKRLVIRGKFQQKQLENVLRRYILEYVTCRTCKSPDTDLKKGENRLFFVTCNSCGSRRSVAAIKTGFQATVGKRRRQKV